MVKIREGLPLVDGQTTQADSASLTAQFAHDSCQPLSNDSSIILTRTSLDIRLLIDNTTHYSDEYLPTAHLNTASIDIQAWLEKVGQRIHQDELSQLHTALEVVKKVNAVSHNQRSGVYATGIGMADILSYLYHDERALVAAMVFRSVRKGLLSLQDVQEHFGKEVCQLVQDTLAMGQLTEAIENNKRLEDHFINNHREQLTNIYNMLIAVTNDVRVVLIKLAERTFAMRELSFASEARQQRVAREVMNIYAPLAHRLGIAQIKWELEDLAFRHLAPERYKEIAKLLAEKRSEREDYIERVRGQLMQALEQAGIQADVSGRVKHIYSIYRKMKLKKLSFDQLYDIRALRVLVDSNSECYHVLGLVHGLWRHIPEQFDDYITNPKSNGYRSLHTAVIAEHKSLEVQIRTHAMHYEAELGMCTHVTYKEGGKNDAYLNQRINSLRQLLAINKDRPAIDTSNKTDIKAMSDDTAEALKLDSDDRYDEEQLVDFEGFERIYVFSRDGDITELPKGATVLDFAYYVHTQVGNQAQAARVNQRYVPLTYELKTGEQVEVITKSNREPNRDWLVPSLGYIHTNRARSKLRQWFNKLDRSKNIDIGRQMLTKELGRLSVHANSVDLGSYVEHFRVKSPDDILVGLVTGDISMHQLTNQILKELNLTPERDYRDFKPSIHPKATGKLDAYKICVDGLDNIDIHLAGCCQAVRGEPIAGFITQSHGVSIHHRGCPEYARLIEREPERQIDATWYSEPGSLQPVEIFIEAYDRRGLLKDLTQVIDTEDINIRKVDTVSTDEDIAEMRIHLEVTGLAQLSKLLAKLEQQPGILQARRAVK